MGEGGKGEMHVLYWREICDGLRFIDLGFPRLLVGDFCQL